MPLIVLPYEPGYKGHRVAEERRKKTAEWLQQRERELDERRAFSLAECSPEPDKKSGN